MAVPKPIHKYLLGEGFRYGGYGVYYRFLPSQPVAQAVAVNETWGGELPGKFIIINLDLIFPYISVIGGGKTLCNDGLLRLDANLSQMWPVEQHAQALEVLRATMHKWLDALSDPDISIALLDYHLGLRDAPLEPFAYVTGFYEDWENVFRQSASIYEAVTSDPWNALKRIYYLLLAGRYAEAEELLRHHAVVREYGNDVQYRWLLACVEQKKIIVLDDFREWAEKKKLIAPGTWESVPESAFAGEAQNTETNEGQIEDICAIFFSGGRKAAAAFVQARYGMDITGQRGKRVVDALDAADDADEGQFILCALSRRWNVLMGDVALADPEADDGISAQLSAASKTTKDGQVLLIGAQDTAGVVWFEYHKGGELKRRWACAEGEVLSNDGAPLNDFDASTFGAEIGEDGAPESGTLAVLAEKITGIAWDTLQKPGALFELECEA